ncbi:CBU_0592 family membrane protein [Jannaschia donghaensis]|uniref:CBU-0592-like domain-containing protein n=1 Tax=Jannaschia donghaensis TaxID=420998 RepID=A0A0M6YCV3_9RHOB|nr:hypothetical protein [Jannaschia donghaensis]CTQ48191.1 hypothetical protein JDO7802_00193 [Jannaschia donghaensis]
MITDMIFALPEPTLQHVGLSGAFLYMMTFALLALGILSGDSIKYFMMNLTAASLVLVSLSQSFNAASLVIQLFWIVVSVISIVVRLRRNRPSNRLRRLG